MPIGTVFLTSWLLPLQPLVSTDYVNDVRSSVVDAASTMVVCGTMVKIYAWYDNEAGYSMRTAELARMVARRFL